MERLRHQNSPLLGLFWTQHYYKVQLTHSSDIRGDQLIDLLVDDDAQLCVTNFPVSSDAITRVGDSVYEHNIPT